MAAEFRKMKKEDSEEVFKMMRVFYDSPAVEVTAPDEVLRRDIKDCIGDMPYLEGFVIECDGAIAGYGMTAMSYTTEYGGLCVWLEDLYIKEEFRKKGIATQFFKYIEETYPQAVRFKLEVEKENETAIKTYVKNGYSVSPYFEMTKEIVL